MTVKGNTLNKWLHRLRPPAPTPARDIVEALSALGWAPPPVYPDGLQVWTVSGIPDGGRADGT